MTPSKGSTVIRPIRTVLLVTALSVLVPVSAAAAAPGDLDTSWSNSGVAYAVADASQELFVDRQGRILAVADHTDREQVLRLRPDGTHDISFPTDPAWVDGVRGDAVLTQDDGVVSASAVSGSHRSPDGVVVHRWRGDATVESAFGEDGEVVVPMPLPSVAGTAVTADGSVLVSGSSQQSGVHRRFVLKLTPGGDLDPSWASGTEQPGIAWDLGGGFVIEPLPDGGALAQCWGTVTCLQRLLPDGRPDPTYGERGTAVGFGDEQERGYLGAVLVAADGSTTAFGRHGSELVLARYDAQGRVDTGFGRAGQVRHVFPRCSWQASCDEYVGHVVRDASGRMYVATSGATSRVYRLDAAGGIDQDWGLDGAIRSSTEHERQATGLALDATGRLLVAWDGVPTGYSTVDSPPRSVDDSWHGDLVRVPAQRILDTRTTRSPLASGGRVTLDLAAALGVEPYEVRGVLLNVTMVPVEPRAGHFAVAPAPSAASSSGNYAGRIEAHFVTTAVDEQGRAALTVSGGRTHALVDVRGYYSTIAGGETRGRYVPAGARGRIADTRSGTGTSAGAMGEGEQRTFRHPHGARGQVAMLAVVTAVPRGTGARSGHLTVGDATSTTSDVNAYGDRAVGNTVLVPMRPDGTYTVYSARAGYDVVVDELVAYLGGSEAYSTPRRYRPHPPTRVLDTRTGLGARRGAIGGTAVSVPVAGVAGVPRSVREVLLTVTAVPTGARAGYVRLPAPHSPVDQEVTAVNFPTGVVTSNTVWTVLDSEGRARVRVGAGTSHVLLDVVGSRS